ncbi:S-adenosyl-L-methionine-dependent methyltransferase [Talaromyces proteolyticus]|uniref:tRNA (uracil(54)-C(5))-methyltransferase n=1 Tax=Talaromyces proteolyticus TaxID=1131652 RepID=A0AAD4Q3K8_9EURO|nr:S-adenosyl-L-methionine-dependent methyltransferase [Talaromyces proteolyticus]KAH8705144.1 S-adenosyl-L-methionine-dependent methyltransferase [Talaromyces proteolyticus]
MSRRPIACLSRSLRYRPVLATVRTQSTRVPYNAIPENPEDPIEQKFTGYFRRLQYENRMKELDDTRRPKDDKRKKLRSKASVRVGESTDDILQTDVERLINDIQKSKAENDSAEETITKATLPSPFSEIEVTVSTISSTGDGLALSEDGSHVFVVPFTIAGDKALVKVVRHQRGTRYSITDLIKVIHAGPERDDSQIKCQYFGQCSGCQLQMLPYEKQLEHKRRIVEKAYANFSGLIPELVPKIKDTFPSPLQYGYRTKLTPHFALFSGRARKESSEPAKKMEVPPIGFNIKNRRTNMDIEDCPLGTDIVRKFLKKERKQVAENIDSYTDGATILLRESTHRIKKEDWKPKDSESSDIIITKEHPDYIEEKTCVTDPNGYSVEYIDDYVLGNKAGAFFQNNNSILSGFTEYIRQQVHSKALKEGEKPIKYLIDAYSGCGLFTVTLSNVFKSSLGIDIDGNSILCARDNAKKNNLPNTGFAAADASLLFNRVPYPADETFLVIDPPRKGCSEDFLRQLLDYGPRRVAYVSCNVHTQARDIGYLVQGNASSDVRYEIESIRGFDFFPQTGHVEGLAILNKV